MSILASEKYYNVGNKWFIIVVYLTLSLLLYSFPQGLIDLFFRELLFSILPFILYACFTKYQYFNHTILKYIVLIVIFINIFGFLMFFDVKISFIQLYNTTVNANLKLWRITSYAGPITLGYLSIIAINILIFYKSLFKYQNILIVILLLGVIMCGQRAPFSGLIIIFIIKLFYSKSKLSTLIFTLSALLITVLLLIYINNLHLIDSDIIGDLLYSYDKKFDTSTMMSTREDQQQILNNYNVFNILFGEGFGKYASSNLLNISDMSDAAYFRLFNELGVVGFVLYFSFFIEKLFGAINSKNPFLISIIIYTLIASFFNRILFAAPMSFIPFILIAVSYKNINDKSILKTSNSV